MVKLLNSSKRNKLQNKIGVAPFDLKQKLADGYTLHQKGFLNEAQRIYYEILNLQPSNFEALQLAGAIELEAKNYKQAVKLLSKSIKLNPNVPNIYCNLSIAFEGLGQIDAAITSYNQAIRLNPNFAEAYCDRGNALQILKQFDAAITNYDQAIRLNPNFAEAYSNRGNALQALKQFDAAITNYDQTIRLNPNFAEAHFNRGRTLSALKLLEQALANYLRAFRMCPETEYLLDYLIYTKVQLCDWEDLDKFSAKFIEKITKKNKASMPFVSLLLLDKPDIHKQCATTYVNEKYPINNALGPIKGHSKNEKIRIGYFSADFRDHPVSYLTNELFELHNRDMFEIIAFSLGPNKQDAIRIRLEKSFDKFLDVEDTSDQEIAILARKMKIDIAIDLGGFTGDCRTEIFAMRVAPIQVNYLGYPGTMGAKFIDYLIADTTVVPQSNQCHYAEKLVYLPRTFMVNDGSSYKSYEKSITRSECNLPEDEFVFACFNASYKITPLIFACWMRILMTVSNSVLWLSSMNETASRNLKMEADKLGISNNRIIFAPKMPLVNDHLNRIKLADLFLDTFPYNAHTTANDALRVGLPLLTLIGESFASRVAASLLNAVGLHELIAANIVDYESSAVELATNPSKLTDIRNKLLSNLRNSPLNNTKLYTQTLEKAYQSMYQQHQDKLIPENINIE